MDGGGGDDVDPLSPKISGSYIEQHQHCSHSKSMCSHHIWNRNNED